MSGQGEFFYPAGLPLSARIFMLIVEERPNPGIQGCIRHLFFSQPEEFLNLTDAILRIDHMMDSLQCPQRDTQRRSFVKTGWKKALMEKDPQMESIGQEEALRQCWPARYLRKRPPGAQVFYIQVYYRQYSSWQGEVYSCKQGEKRRFRSVLELLYFIQSALAS